MTGDCICRVRPDIYQNHCKARTSAFGGDEPGCLGIEGTLDYYDACVCLKLPVNALFATPVELLTALSLIG